MLSDSSGAIAKLYGVSVKPGGSVTCTINDKEMHLIRDVTTSRWTFIIGKKGNIIYIDSQADPATDSKKVLQAIQDFDQSTKS